MAAAGSMDEAARRAMVEGMVARLAERLKTETQDVEGWLRLVRAYAVLDERDKAREATEAARRALGGNDTARARIDALARDLGLGG
jgi:cytochrome c-type biogenesis protein CcmH